METMQCSFALLEAKAKKHFPRNIFFKHTSTLGYWGPKPSTEENMV